MKKKSLRTQVKSLEHELEHKEQSLLDAYKKIRDLEHETSMKRAHQEYTAEVHRYKSEVDRLLEIIRWMVKPSTAETPFDKPLSEKTQRQKDNF